MAALARTAHRSHSGLDAIEIARLGGYGQLGHFGGQLVRVFLELGGFFPDFWLGTGVDLVSAFTKCGQWQFRQGGNYIGEQLLIKRIMGHALTLPDAVWTRLNIAWIGFFLFCGAANLFVAFTFQSIWVDFKVFGSLGMTVLFLVAQGIYLSRHLHDADTTTPKTED